MEVKFFLNGEFVVAGCLKVLPRIGERAIATFLPGTCNVVDIVHDLAYGTANIYLSY